MCDSIFMMFGKNICICYHLPGQLVPAQWCRVRTFSLSATCGRLHFQDLNALFCQQMQWWAVLVKVLVRVSILCDTFNYLLAIKSKSVLAWWIKRNAETETMQSRRCAFLSILSLETQIKGLGCVSFPSPTHITGQWSLDYFQLVASLRWLAEHCPEQLALKVEPLRDFVENCLSEDFYTLVFQDLAQRKNNGLPHQVGNEHCVMWDNNML